MIVAAGARGAMLAAPTPPEFTATLVMVLLLTVTLPLPSLMPTMPVLKITMPSPVAELKPTSVMVLLFAVAALTEQAYKDGMKPLRISGAAKVAAGMTTVDSGRTNGDVRNVNV